MSAVQSHPLGPQDPQSHAAIPALAPVTSAPTTIDPPDRHNSIGDEAVSAFARALLFNSTLERLDRRGVWVAWWACSVALGVRYRT